MRVCFVHVITLCGQTYFRLAARYSLRLMHSLTVKGISYAIVFLKNVFNNMGKCFHTSTLYLLYRPFKTVDKYLLRRE